MEDIVIVTGVLLLRPPEEGDGGITCDGVIQFRSPAGRKQEQVPGTYEIVTSPGEDTMIAENGSTE